MSHYLVENGNVQLRRKQYNLALMEEIILLTVQLMKFGSHTEEIFGNEAAFVSFLSEAGVVCFNNLPICISSYRTLIREALTKDEIDRIMKDVLEKEFVTYNLDEVYAIMVNRK